MKSLLSNLLCASLLFFAVGCGKDKDKSSDPGLPLMNPIISPNFPQYGQQALNNLKAWYSSPESGNSGFRGVYQKKTQTSSGSFNFNFSYCFFGRGNACDTNITPTHCFRKNSDGNYDVGTATGTAIDQCTITQPNLTKATNSLLTQAVNGNGMHLLEVQQHGNLYFLVYGVNYQPSVVYTIDTSMHSIFNPVKVQNISNGSVSTTEITNIQYSNY